MSWVDTVTREFPGYLPGRYGVQTATGIGLYLFYATPSQALEHTQTPTLHPGVIRPVGELIIKILPSARIKNKCSHTSIRPTRLHDLEMENVTICY